MERNLFDVKDWDDIHDALRLGEILMSAGKINYIHLKMALDIQKFQKNLQLGEILLKIKAISNGELEAALNIQKYLISKN